jgi:cytochrome P450
VGLRRLKEACRLLPAPAATKACRLLPAPGRAPSMPNPEWHRSRGWRCPAAHSAPPARPPPGAPRPRPQNTLIVEPFYAMSRAAALYGADADQFRPQRWLKPAAGDAVVAGDGAKAGPPDAMPFSVGAHAMRGGRALLHLRLSPFPHARVAPQALRAAPPCPGRSVPAPHRRRPSRPPPPCAPGPRDCVGQALAMLELQAVIATLVGRFEWALPGAGGGLGTTAPLQQLLCYHM